MRRFVSVLILALSPLVFAAFASGCGYLPSQMEPQKKTESSTGGDLDHSAKIHTSSCTTRAKGYTRLGFDDLYDITNDPQQPFKPAADVPEKYDVRAYVWGYDNCMEKGTCSHGDRYWLIKRGPGNDFSTWVVTPQYPRITIESRCKGQLKVGERYRFSFKNGNLVGFSKN